jgi:hypothetical protein
VVNARIDAVRDERVAHVDESVNALAAITKTGFEQVEKRLNTIEADVGELKTDRIETELDQHETRIEALEPKPWRATGE